MSFYIFQFDNVNACLNILRTQSVGGLESITTSDICSGRLKAVLALFFALSRYKQAAKQKTTSTTTVLPIKQQNCQQPQHHQQQIQQPTLVSNAAYDMTNR